MSKIADHIAANANIPQRAARELVEHFAQAVRELAEVDGAARIPGFGTFRLQHKAERQGRNPRTGEAIPIKARNVVTFHASHKLKAIVQGDIPAPEEFE